MNLRVFHIVLSLVFFMCFALPTSAQHKKSDYLKRVMMDGIPVLGWLRTEEGQKPINTGEVLIIDVNNDTTKYPVKNSRFSFLLPYNNIYTIHFTADGYASKSIFVDLITAHRREKHTAQIVEFGVRLIKFIPGVDYSLLDTPVAVAKFDDAADEITFDYEYTENIQEKLMALSKEIEEMKVMRISF